MTQIYLIIIIATAILVWLSVLTFFLFKSISHYNRLVQGTNKESLVKILDGIIQDLDLKDGKIADITKSVAVLQRQGVEHLQRVGFVRFNPFNETGGDNSFTICLLDGSANGIVITGLHTREKTRMYAKKIEKGKSKYDLSKEEKQAISEALQLN